MAKKVARFTEKLDDKDTQFVVKFPTRQQQHAANIASIKAFNEAQQAGALPRDCLNNYMIEKGLWDEEKQKRLETLARDLMDGERQLARGGITKDGKKFSKKDARDLAIKMRVWRIEQLLLLAKSRELDKYTLESQAENAKFDFLVSECTFTEEGKRVFDGIDDYLAKSDEAYAGKAAMELSNMLYDMDENYEKNKPENKFLLKFGFIRDTDLHLINEEGKLVDSEGRLVNEQGRLINEKNELVDVNGNLVDDEGNPVETFTPFDEDEQIKVEVEASEETTEEAEEDEE